MNKQLDTDFRIGYTSTEDPNRRAITWNSCNLPRTRKRRDRYVLLIHGFNVRGWEAERGFDKFRKNAANLAKAEFSRDMLSVSWPGKILYWKAIRIAKGQAALLLAKHLASLKGKTSDHCEVILIGHSLGCRLILEALRHLERDAEFWRTKHVDVFLMAAAVPIHLVERWQRLYDGTEHARGRMIFYSWDDWVLKHTFPYGQMLAARTDPEEGLFPKAVGATGLPAGSVWTDRRRKIYGHSEYWRSKDIVQEIAQKLNLAKKRVMSSRELATR